MAHPAYRDDPFEADEVGKPFTEDDWRRYAWADAWRCAVHAIERELYGLPEVRQAYAEAKALEQINEAVVYVSEQSVASLTKATAGLRAAEPAPKSRRRPK